MAVQNSEADAVVTSGRANLPIVVGVDGSEPSLRAVEWAAREAVYAGCPVRLVHAYPSNALYEPPALPVGRARAELAFDAARERLEAPRYDGIEVSTHASQGSARRVLLRAAADARMLVVGRRDIGRLAALLLASTSMACAMHAVTPVTVVPVTWEPAAAGSGTVLLGVDGSGREHAAVEHAFSVAAELEQLLVAVMALDGRSGYTHDGAEEILLDVLAAWREKLPDVEVATAVADGAADEVLARYAAEADRVVIGGRGHGVVTGALLGSVARSTLRGMPCPVTVVHSSGTG